MNKEYYELCKKLKETGFPQSANWNADAHKTPNSVFLQVQKDGFYIPNLTELIEACGDKFHGIYIDGHNVWHAHAFYGLEMWEDINVLGSTSEEAVAKLWLSLNKK